MNILHFEHLPVTGMKKWKTIFRFTNPTIAGSSEDKDVTFWGLAEGSWDTIHRKLDALIDSNVPAMDAH